MLCQAAPVVLPSFRGDFHPHVPLKHRQQSILHVQIPILLQQIVVDVLIGSAKLVDVWLFLRRPWEFHMTSNTKGSHLEKQMCVIALLDSPHLQQHVAGDKARDLTSMLALAIKACASMLLFLLDAQTIANLSRGILRCPVYVTRGSERAQGGNTNLQCGFNRLLSAMYTKTVFPGARCVGVQ